MKQLVEPLLVLGAGFEFDPSLLDHVGEVGLQQHGAVNGDVIALDKSPLLRWMRPAVDPFS
jgi:hypothetical protein